ncbi:cation:proton antiporter [Streptomyces sp. NPDC094038]|uniref:cation:proton antiporter domain-containing protein n=1 Tax=Streptomyces sp. NPDC094038 TaxID=3366055 RepID=UPI00381FD4AA
MTDTLAAAPVPPVGAHPMLLFLLQVGVLLSLAIVPGRLAVRLGLPAIVGGLTAGVPLGPSLAGWAAPGAAGRPLPRQPEQMHLLDAVGQVAVLLLVGLTGMETDLRRVIRRRRSTALRVGLAGLLIPLGLGIALGYPLAGLLDPDSDTTVFVMFMGVAMCVSAIPVIAKTLMDMGLIHRAVRRSGGRAARRWDGGRREAGGGRREAGGGRRDGEAAGRRGGGTARRRCGEAAVR